MYWLVAVLLSSSILLLVVVRRAEKSVPPEGSLAYNTCINKRWRQQQLTTSMIVTGKFLPIKMVTIE